ncbi:copper resistance protein B [uncultured Sphingomonas sp.]|uniref:copper resistance protein B n=1 Tax=uncultured Sphingomonas sp. TaxID=158754 RepID=UPI0025E8A4A5|nr:copper resistance protein B [uncultured Sphingomonas sp.]
MIRLFALALLGFAASAMAQTHDMHGHHGMAMPKVAPVAPRKAAPPSRPKPAPARKAHHPQPKAATPTAVDSAPAAPPPHDHSMMDHAMPAADRPVPVQVDAPHDHHMMMHGMAGKAEGQPTEVGHAAPPPPPGDHAADRLYPAARMAAARRLLAREHGGMTYSMLIADIAEWQARKGRDGYRWDGEGWFGGDLNRLVVKTEGEGARGRTSGAGEAQALYSRAIDPYWNIQAGLRQDFGGGRSPAYAVVAVEGLAPFWFETEASAFLSQDGNAFARLSGYYDQRITQALVLQPRVELAMSAQDVPRQRLGSGLTGMQLDLRLRYEIRRAFAPYVGISHERRFARTARLARMAGDDARSTSIVFGIRGWL